MNLFPRLLGTRYTTISIANLDEYYRIWMKIILSGAEMISPAHGSPFPAEKLKFSLWKIKRLIPKPDSLMKLFQS